MDIYHVSRHVGNARLTIAGAQLSIKSFSNLRQIAQHLNRNYRNRMMYIAYKMAPGARYRTFSIPKKNGDERRICAPRAALLDLQRDMKKLIEADYRPRAHVHGFVSNRQRGIVSNARPHIQKQWVLNIDLKDFFETIHFGRVVGRLRAPPYEYPPEISNFIAHIACFQTTKEVNGVERETSVLMPGGALSPLLANIVTDKLDGELSRLCKQLGCAYTRYADDITISSNRRRFPSRIARFDDVESQTEVLLSESFQEIIESNGFQINHEKTRLLGKSFKQEVTGLVVNQKVNVKRTFVREVRAMLYDWEQNGLDEASSNHFMNKRPDRGRLVEYEAVNFEWVVHGKLEFVKQVKGSADPVFRRLAARFNVLTTGMPFALPIIETDDVLNAAVWYLENDVDAGSVGTCFAIEPNLFVTCAHCLGDGLRIFSRAQPMFSLPAEVVVSDVSNDVALIRISNPLPAFEPAATLEMAEDQEVDSVTINDAVQVAGYPSNSDQNTLTIRASQVTGYSRITFSGTPSSVDNVFELISGTYEGMSGGPLLKDGKVVGVIVRGPNDSDRTVSCKAVRANFATQLIDSLT